MCVWQLGGDERLYSLCMFLRGGDTDNNHDINVITNTRINEANHILVTPMVSKASLTINYTDRGHIIEIQSESMLDTIAHNHSVL